MLRKLLPGTALAGVATAALVRQQYLEWESMTLGSASAEEHLPLSAEAQPTHVVHVRRFLSDVEIEAGHAKHSELKPQLGSAGRNANNQAASYRNGAWETSYLSTDGLFAKTMPELRQRLISLAQTVDAQNWKLLDRATDPILPRCVEYHTVEPGGSLPFVHHYDAGSLLTVDVMLSDSSEYEGGVFRTLECDGSMKEHSFEKGDALIFVSHKFHCVSPVTAGRRQVLVMELWEGVERECAHRCERHTGYCGHTARASFWRRALSDLGSDL